MALEWVSARLTDGQVIADLPGVQLPDGSPLRRSISNSDAAQVTLFLPDAPENWREAVYEGGAVLAAYDNTDETKAIVWAGYVTQIDLDAGADSVGVTLSTFEAVLDRAFVGDTTYTTAQHRDDILADLMATWFAPIGVAYAVDYAAGGGPTPALMDSPPTPNAAIVMQNTDNATVKGRFDQVCAQLGGEYTVEWSWANSGRALLPTVRWGSRIGAAVLPGMAPAVTYELPGSLITLQQSRSYAAGDGANRVRAYSTGQGTTTPYAAPVDGPEDGRPIFEYRYQPAPSLSPSALAQYAAQAIKILAPGKRPITLVASTARQDGRRLGTDWRLGDTIGYRVAAQYANEQGATVTVLAFPDGLSGTGRCIAYERTETTVTPILADAVVYVQDGA